MLNFKKKFTNPVKDIKHQADNLNKTIKSASEDLNKKIHESGKSIDESLKKPMEYNYLIFLLPIIMVVFAFIPMSEWILQIIRLIICCSMGYVLYFEYRLPKKRDNVFMISLALVVLFNPVIPFYIPGAPINIIAILAIAYLAKLTLMDSNKS